MSPISETEPAKQSPAFQAYFKIAAELSDLKAVINALGWDQETIMPEKAGKFRSSQMGTLHSIYHSRLVSNELGDALDQLDLEPLDLWGRASVREARRLRDKALKVPADLVGELARTTSLSYQNWVKARQESDLAAFTPWLKKLVELKRLQAQCLRIGERPYDSLLDDYEPGMTVKVLDPLFGAIRPRLTELLERVRSAPRQHARQLIRRDYPEEVQEAFGRQVLTAMGFDWDAGRLDKSPHPFCSGLTPFDVRITTRYQRDDFSVAFFGMVHEGGHALYEQGLDSQRYGLTACETISLGIHESQSRLWENLVTRSRPFWERWYEPLCKAFPGQLDDVALDAFMGAINRVKPSMIRVDADELTYGLHVILRYELEKALLENQLEVSELEEVWNRMMLEYLGVQPKNAAEGVLQDVHWSIGLFGYFSTYLLGTLYASQFHRQAERDVPDQPDHIRRGDFSPLREWLREKIHLKGMTRTANELVLEVTGEPLNPEHFLTYLRTKYGELYGF